MQNESNCWCGRPLHYKNKSDKQMVEGVVSRFGEYINVQVEDDKTYRVPRHYIALHGITGKDLPALGFQEVQE